MLEHTGEGSKGVVQLNAAFAVPSVPPNSAGVHAERRGMREREGQVQTPAMHRMKSWRALEAVMERKGGGWAWRQEGGRIRHTWSAK